jgi:hypothetical protein
MENIYGSLKNGKYYLNNKNILLIYVCKIAYFVGKNIIY